MNFILKNLCLLPTSVGTPVSSDAAMAICFSPSRISVYLSFFPLFSSQSISRPSFSPGRFFWQDECCLSWTFSQKSVADVNNMCSVFPPVTLCKGFSILYSSPNIFFNSFEMETGSRAKPYVCTRNTLWRIQDFVLVTDKITNEKACVRVGRGGCREILGVCCLSAKFSPHKAPRGRKRKW